MSDYTDSKVKQATDLFIEGLKSNTLPFQRRWEPGEFRAPYNPVSGTRYRGINFVMLSGQGLSDPRWLTFNQTKSQQYTLEGAKGKGVPIIFWSTTSKKLSRDSDGKPRLGADGEKIYSIQELNRPLLRVSTVFNGSLINGLPELEYSNVEIQNDKAKRILTSSGANIIHDQLDRAYCDRRADEIHLPPQAQFKSEGDYLVTAMHELAHWSMHNDRLGTTLKIDPEDLKQPFGSIGYAREELRAEIASFMFNAELNIGFDVGQHQSYVNSWVRILEDAPDELGRACADAEKIVDYVLNLERTIEVDLKMDSKIETIPSAEFLANASDSALADGEYNVQIKKGGSWVAADGGKGLKTIESAYGFANALVKNIEDPNELSEVSIVAPDNRRYTVTQEMSITREFTGADLSSETKHYLAIPYSEKDSAKKIARKNDVPLFWDATAEAWFTTQSQSVLDKWKPSRTNTVAPVTSENMSPEQEFAARLRDAGFDVGNTVPMDGKFHRVAIVDGKTGNLDGAFRGHLDGRPAGFFQNHMTGEKGNWTASGTYVSLVDKTTLKAINAQRMQDRDLAQNAVFNERAKELAMQLSSLPSIAKIGGEHPYLQQKDARVGNDCKVNASRQLVVPIYNSSGALQSAQYINHDGEKRLAAGAKKAGGMYVFSNDESTSAVLSGASNSKDIYIVEGLATGSTVHEATGSPVAVAFDAGNLHAVAQHFKQAYPDTNIHICADNDIGKEVNRGREAAERVSEALDINFILPRLLEGKGSDFNDLKAQQGLDVVKAQIRTGVALYQQKKQSEVTRSEINSGKPARGNDAINSPKKERTLRKQKEKGAVER